MASRLLQQGNDTLVQIDDDGAAGAASSIRTVATLTGVRAQDVLLNSFVEGYNQDGSQHGMTVQAGGSDVFNGGNGNDRMSVYYGQYVLDGLLNGGSGNDIIKVQTDGEVGAFGGSGNDRIEINANDYLAQGRVLANGGEGDDAIILTRETQKSNLVTAIGGSDRFGVVGSVGTSMFGVRDVAVGAGGDRIDVSALLSGAVPPGDPFASGVLRYLQSANDTLVQFDADGAAGAQANFVTMMKLQGVLATTLTAAKLITAVEPALVGLASVAGGWA